MNSKRKSNDASDPQRQKVYDWEHQWDDWNKKRISLKECRDHLHAACEMYGVDEPTLSPVGDCWGFSGYWQKENAIVLVRDHQNAASVLHEATHCILNTVAPKAQDHGPTFAGVFIYLLVAAELCPAEAIYASARKAGVKWSKKTTPEDLGQ